MIVTTRGLCCCPSGPAGKDDDDGRVIVTKVKDIPAAIAGVVKYGPRPEATAADAPPRGRAKALAAQGSELGALMTAAAATAVTAADDDCDCDGKPGAPRMSARQANRVGEFLRTEMIRSFNDPRPEHAAQPFVDTDLFVTQLAGHVARSRRGRAAIARTLDELGKISRSSELETIARAYAEAVGRKPDQIAVGDLLRTSARDLARMAKVSPAEVARAKLGLLGVPVKGKPSTGKPHGKKGD
jgi:hypothetical protein